MGALSCPESRYKISKDNHVQKILTRSLEGQTRNEIKFLMGAILLSDVDSFVKKNSNNEVSLIGGVF